MSDELNRPGFDPAMGEWYQDAVASLPGDELPVAITVLQASKLAAIIAAGRRGHIAYQNATRTVVDFLEALALEAKHGLVDVRLSRSAAQLWTELDELPWPIAGPPQPQQH